MAGFVIRKGSDEGRQAYITGNRGRYDELIKNPRVRYARNAMSNLKEYASYRMPKVKYPNLSGIAKVSDDVFEQKLKELDNSIMASETALQSMPPLSYTIRYLPEDKSSVDVTFL